MNRGWRFESYRHALAARGISTTNHQSKFFVQKREYQAVKACLECGAHYNTKILRNPFKPARCPVCGSAAGVKSSGPNDPLPDAVYAVKFKHGDKPDWEFNKEELKKGVQVEKEHTDDESIAKQIAKAHLSESPQYYKDLEKIESKKPGKVDSVAGIPIKADAIDENQIYPVSIEDVKRRFSQLPKEDLKDIESIEFKKPVGEQKDAYGQYIRSKRSIYVFAQPFSDGKVDGKNPKEIRKHILEYVIPHEVGHHKALHHKKLWDKDIRVAEARADANVVGLGVDDKAVAALVK